MVKARRRVKGPHPLQKPWVSSRFKMARSGQGRQRLKTFLLIDRARKEPLLPSAKIRSKWSSHQIFGVAALRFPIAGTICSRSIVANTTCSIAIRAGMGIWHPRFFLSSITSAIQTCLVAARARLWTRCLCFFFSSITSAIQTCLVVVRAKLKDLSFLCIPIFFLFVSVVSFWYRLV